MKIGDLVTIKNKAGMLKVRIEKELSLSDVSNPEFKQTETRVP